MATISHPSTQSPASVYLRPSDELAGLLRASYSRSDTDASRRFAALVEGIENKPEAEQRAIVEQLRTLLAASQG